MPNIRSTARFAVQTSSGESSVPSFSFWTEYVAAMRKVARLKHDLEHLHAMSDHELRDIGVTRDQIDIALRRGRRALPSPRI